MKTTRETQYGVIWGADVEPVIQWGVHSVQHVREAAELTQKRLMDTTEVMLPFKLVQRDIEYSEGEWKDV